MKDTERADAELLADTARIRAQAEVLVERLVVFTEDLHAEVVRRAAASPRGDQQP